MARPERRGIRGRRVDGDFERLEARALLASLPGGFAATTMASGLAAPTAMEIAADGRLYIAEQGGRLEVFQGGTRLQSNFFRDSPLTVDSSGERGLLGVALDPGFATNRFVYVYYTATTPTTHNRLSRFTADASGTLALAGTETVLLDIDPLSAATNHNGGAIHFAADGTLFVAVGDNADGTNSQSLATLKGKILRINPDGTIPADNPFFGTATGKNRAIWALGLRNPFTFTFQPGTGRIFINDVGQNTFEEIDTGGPGANFGWPTTEGPTTDPRFVAPFYSYDHSVGQAVTGGAFNDPANNRFPADYAGDYFFADFVAGTIWRIDTTTRAVQTFATAVEAPVDLRFGSDGGLYTLERGSGRVLRIDASQPPAPTPGTPIIAQIQFQPSGSATAAGFQADTGAVFGPKAGGASFGWAGNNGASTRDRLSPRSPDRRYDTFAEFRRGRRSRWEIAVPDGTYTVRIVSGDARSAGVPARIRAEGVLAVRGRTTRSARWLDRTVTVAVTDGRLTLAGTPGSLINFVEITRAST